MLNDNYGLFIPRLIMEDLLAVSQDMNCHTKHLFFIAFVVMNIFVTQVQVCKEAAI